MPSIRTTSPSSKPSRPSSRARQNGNAIPTPRALSPSPPGSSPASAAGPATTASPDPRSCDEASKTSERSSTELLWRFTMCESDSRGRGRDPRRGRGRVRGWPIACLPISCVKQPPLLRNGPFLSREGRGTRGRLSRPPQLLRLLQVDRDELRDTAPGHGNADLALLRRLHRLDEQLGGRRRAEEHPHLVDEPVFTEMHQVNFVKGHSLYLARELDGMPAVGGFAKSDEGKTVHRLLDLAEVRGNAVNACRGRIARGRMHLDRRGELSADLFPIALQYAGDVVLQSFHHLQTSR